MTGASPLVQTSSSELGTTVQRGADLDAAAERPQLRQPDPDGAGRGPRHSRARTSTAPAALRGAPRRRSRRTASGRATTTTCSTASTTTRPGCRRSCCFRASTRSTSSSCRPAPTRRSSAARSAASSTCRSSPAATSCTAAASSSCATTRSTPTTSSTTAPDARSRTFSQHQFGGTIGGPIVKDKTFYFFDYQGYRVNQGATYLSTVPSARMRAGDFSELNRIIYDPLHRPAVRRQRRSRRPAGTRRRKTSSTS